MERVERSGHERVSWIHSVAKKVWGTGHETAFTVQERCIQAWDRIEQDSGLAFKPLVPVENGRPVSCVIFGSGGFSTGAFQADQFFTIKQHVGCPPVELAAIVANKSTVHGCNGRRVAEARGIPLVELDFIDWYAEYIDPGEENPVAASRYWFPPGTPDRPGAGELARRFRLRQVAYHGALGNALAAVMDGKPVDIASARGYNFQFCSSMFPGQELPPHVNDTHPADLTFVDAATGAKLYPGWQAGAIKLMMEAGHESFRGSLIEVSLMDDVAQIDELDEGALLAIGGGVSQLPPPEGPLSATAIQERMKIVDDHIFCTLEPTGLLLAWGISEQPVPVKFQDVVGNSIEVMQHAIVVGDEIRSGINAFGRDLHADLASLQAFLVR